jgi:hypothetical protein
MSGFIFFGFGNYQEGNSLGLVIGELMEGVVSPLGEWLFFACTKNNK